jgi:hypothetical protein
MKNRSFHYLLAFAVLVLAISLSCSVFNPTPTSSPSQPTQPQSQSTQPQPQQTQPQSTQSTSDTSTSSDLVTFTDKNNYYQIDLPGDWKHTTGTDTNLYIDTFTSPDKNALVENIVYDDGKVLSGNLNGRFALVLLNDFYSYTKKEGDIRISDDSIQNDGSERLTWTSKGGGYSGASYFEVRKRTTFMMITIEWNNAFENTYIDKLNNVISSYKIP